eukprot:7090644-Prymnesium_polylepis.1
MIQWFDPCEAAALDATLRVACGVPADQQYLLLDAATMSGVALSSSMPSDSTYELCILPAAGAQQAVVVVDPVSTGAVLCHQLVTQRGCSVIVVWSNAM